MADDPWADDPNDRYGGRHGSAEGPDAADGPHADLGTYASDRDVEAPNPKKAVGTGVKVLVGLVVGGGLLAALCCGGVIWDSFAAVEVDDTPAGVRAKTDELLTLAVPDDYEPRAGRGISLPVLRWIAPARLDAALYDTPGGGRLELVRTHLPPNLPADDREEYRQLLDQQLTGQVGAGPRFTMTKSDTRALPTADGRTVAWSFAEGTAGALGDARQVTGTVEEGPDVYTLELLLPEAEYDEAEVVALLQSLAVVTPGVEPVPAGNAAPLEEAEVPVEPVPVDPVDADAADGPAS